MRRLPLLSALLALTFASDPAEVAGQEQERYLPSIQQIVDQGKLRIAVIDVSRTPMIRQGDEDELGGFDVALAREIADALDVEPEFLRAGPERADVIDLVAAGEADIGLSYISESVEAAKRVLFTQPYLIEAHTALINRVKGLEFGNDCPSRLDLRRLAKQPGIVGFQKQSFYDISMHKLQPDIEPVLFDGFEPMLEAVESGEIMVSLQGELVAKYYLSRNPQAAIRLNLCEVASGKHRVAAVVRPDALDLVRWLDLYIGSRGIVVDMDNLIYREDEVVY